MPKQIILVRHGETPHNVEGRLMGWSSDVGLNETGKKQALELADNLQRFAVDAMYHSDLRRTVETAGIISHKTGIISTAEPLIRERNLGFFAEKTWEELQSGYPDLWSKFLDHSDQEWRIPEGESLTDISVRFRRFLDILHAKHGGQTVLLVTHSGFINNVLRDVFRFFPTDYFLEVAHNSVTVLAKSENSYKLAAYNEIP